MKSLRALPRWGTAAVLLPSLVACGKPASREAVEAQRPRNKVVRVAKAAPDTAVFVARQAGGPMEGLSAVMQLQVSGRDARITITDSRALRASASRPGEEAEEQIPGSRAWATAPSPESDADSLPSALATVRVPALVGERYLVEVEPLVANAGMTMVSLSADGVALSTVPFPMTSSLDESSLYEVAVTSRGVEIGGRIEAVELVPSCSTLHVARSSARASLYAQYRVQETGETGELFLPARAPDARFRSVTFQTRSPGSVSITYLGYELANAPVPEGCPGS